MDGYENGIGDALKRVESFIGISRWLWVVNLAAMVAGLVNKRYELAAISGFTSVSALVATAVGRIAARHLGSLRRTTIPVRQREAA